MKEKIGTYIVSLIIIVLTLGYDQWTKHIVEQSIQLNERIEVIKNFFYLTYVQNTGAGFSLFEGFGMTFFAIVTIVALILIGYIYFMVNDYRYQLALALVFSGAIGNFIDRLVLGYVRDFFSFYIFGSPFPVFNVADICITIGFAILLIIYIYDEYKEKKRWKQGNLS